MRHSKQFLLLSTLFIGSLFSGMTGCGEGSGGSGPDLSGSALSITPSGTTNLKKNQTLDFNTNLEGATFSVEGGAANGSIDANGLYTPPSTLPVNTHVTIKAQLGSQSASSIVNLFTADAIIINGASKKKITDTALSGIIFNIDVAMNLSRSRLAISDSATSQKIASNWTSYDGVNTNSNYDLMPNLTTFGSDKAAATPADNPYSGTIAYGTDGTLYIVQMEKMGATHGLKIYSSTNDGASYNSHTVHTDVALNSMVPSLAVASDNSLHLIFTKGTSPLAPQKTYYTKSTDGGAIWTSPLEINSASPNAKLQPNIATNAAGNEVDICWLELSASQTDVFYARSTNGGSTFGAPVQITNSPAIREGQCQVKRGLGSDTYLLYSGLNVLSFVENIEVFVAKTSDGSSFTPAVQVNSDAYHLHTFPFMSVDALGRVDLIWAWDKDGDGSDIYESIYHARSIDGGITYSANDAYLQDAGGNAVVPMGLAHDASGRLHMTFVQKEGADYHLFYQMAE